MLVQLQNLSDNKIGLAQNMVDQIDIKTRQLESQSRGANNSLSIPTQNSSNNVNVNSYSNTNGNTNSNGRGANNTSSSVTSQNSNNMCRPETNSERSKDSSNTKDNNGKESSSNHPNGNGKRSSRRAHGNKKDSNPDSNGGGSGDERSSTPVLTERASSNKRANKRGMKGAQKNEGKRRKNSYNYNNDSPTTVYGNVDPDEPTYCLCEQVSYGEMICCDNPTCKIEWFHFLCVSLTAIPKGRWFCPNCRGERSNILRK